MSEIVGGFLMPHNPLMFGNPKGAKPEQRDAVMGAFAEIGRRISDLQATSAIIVGTDHYVLFGPKCLPLLLVAVGDLEGPLERIEGMDRSPIPSNQPLAAHIADFGRNAGFDWAIAKSMILDHSTAIPYHMSLRDFGNIPVIPIYQSCGVEPIVSLRRSRQLGEMLANAVSDWGDGERIVVIGSGGISHWVGESEMGRVNEDFDREVLGLVEDGDIEGLCGMSDEYIQENGGNGAMEIRNFVCAMAAVGCERGETIEYQPVRGWITGMGFAQLYPAN